jgi:hypothetical protein
MVYWYEELLIVPCLGISDRLLIGVLICLMALAILDHGYDSLTSPGLLNLLMQFDNSI